MEKKDRPPLRAELISGATGLREHRAPWRELYLRMPDASPHRSPAWALAHLECGSLHGQPCLLIVWRGETPAALLALERRTLCGTEIIRPLGTGIPGSLGVLCDPNELEAIDALAEAILLRGWDVIQFDDLDERDQCTQAFLAALDARGVQVTTTTRTRMHAIELRHDFHEHLEKTKTARRRRKLRHEWKSLERDADPRIERYRGPSITTDVIERVIALQQKSWLRRRGAATLGDGFHRHLLRTTAADDLLRAWILTISGEDAAFVLALTGGQTLHYAWTAFDLQFEQRSVGKYLAARVIEDACREGFARLDFGQGEAEYKAFWATGSSSVTRVAFGCTWRGRLFIRALALSWRARRWKLLRRIWLRLQTHDVEPHAVSASVAHPDEGSTSDTRIPHEFQGEHAVQRRAA